MAWAVLVATPEQLAVSQPFGGNFLSGDLSSGQTPLGFALAAELVVLDRYAQGRSSLRIAAGGGPQGRRVRLYCALDSVGEPHPVTTHVNGSNRVSGCALAARPRTGGTVTPARSRPLGFGTEWDRTGAPSHGYPSPSAA